MALSKVAQSVKFTVPGCRSCRTISGKQRGVVTSPVSRATAIRCNTQHPEKNDVQAGSGFQEQRRHYGEQRYQQQRHDAVGRQVRWTVAGLSAGVGTVGLLWYAQRSRPDVSCAEQPALSDTPSAGAYAPHLPYFRTDDIRAHNTNETGMWVTYNDGVYDITEFVESHPGGKKILLAAGGQLEPFWNIYAVHKNETIYEILEAMRIGNVHPDDKKQYDSKVMSCPYSTDPQRHPAMYINSLKPYDAETPQALLTENFLTPNELFYVRNHLPVPEIDADEYHLDLGHDASPGRLRLTLDDLKTKFPVHVITATLQCAGNRRGHMAEVKSLKLKGSSGMTAISNAEWTGVKLADVLEHLGVTEEQYNHVIFVGHDKDISGSHYEASIPIETAMDPKRDVLLAFQMNGVDLPRDHGYPLRLVVPGTIGARQVKWLKTIHVSKQESQGHWQQNDYKSFHPSVEWHTADLNQGHAIQDYPVQSAICEPEAGCILDDADEVTVKGYAWSGGGRGIIRVEVSADGGKTWHQAQLRRMQQKLHRQWAWSLFEATIPLPVDHQQVELICKAVDSSHNQQPDNAHGIWNMMGLIHNAWHRVPVRLPLSEDL